LAAAGTAGVGLAGLAAVALARRAARPEPGEWFAVTVEVEEATLSGPERPDALARLAERHEIRIRRAPGGRGSEIAVRAAGGGTREQLRQLKQLLETGEMMLVEQQPEGRRTLLGRTAVPALRQLSRRGTL
jgi:hypothetical protein